MRRLPRPPVFPAFMVRSGFLMSRDAGMVASAVATGCVVVPLIVLPLSVNTLFTAPTVVIAAVGAVGVTGCAAMLVFASLCRFMVTGEQLARLVATGLCTREALAVAAVGFRGSDHHVATAAAVRSPRCPEGALRVAVAGRRLGYTSVVENPAATRTTWFADALASDPALRRAALASPAVPDDVRALAALAC